MDSGDIRLDGQNITSLPDYKRSKFIGRMFQDPLKGTAPNLTTKSKMTYTIVSPHEMNLREGKISIKSPVGQALLGKRKGDEVTVRVPAGLLKLRIENVEL